MIDLTTLAAAKAYTDKKCGGVEKTVLFDGKPTRTDLTSMGMGFAYLLSSEDLFSLAYGQNVHYEYTLADGTTENGVESHYYYMSELSVPVLDGAFTLLFVPALGGTGVSFNYADVGEITNLKLWTEYSEDKPYYLRGLALDHNTLMTLPYDMDKAYSALQNGQLLVYFDSTIPVHPAHVYQVENGVDTAFTVYIFENINIGGEMHIQFSSGNFYTLGSTVPYHQTVLANKE